MKVGAIENLLDQCLLTEEEMALGPDQWKETMEHLDRVNLVLEEEDDEEDGDEEEGEEERGGNFGKRNKKKDEEDCRDKDCKDVNCTEE